MPAPLKPSRWPTFITAGVVGVLLWGFYFAYTANIDSHEAVAGLISAAIATLGVLVFAHQCHCHYHLRLRDLAQGWRVPINAVTGTGQALLALGRQLFTRAGAPSVQKAVPFDAGPEEDPVAAGRRALAVFYTTLTPNSVVVGVFKDEHRIVVHQVIPSELSPMTKNLGAQA